MTSASRSLAWWSLAEGAVRRLTKPHCDIARSDADVERLLTGSMLFGMASSVAAVMGRAWTDSQTSRWLRPVLADFPLPTMTDRVRVAGFVAVIAALTALALHAADPKPMAWLDSLLPAGMAIAGLFVVAAARPIARALADPRP